MRTFLLRPSGKDYIWGGTRLRDEFHKDLPLDPLAESWECSTHPDGPSYVASGKWTGMSLTEVLKAHPELLGNSPSVTALEGLPVLIKFIDAKNDLSVQVHPDDEYAMRMENGQAGKTEMWYVVDAEPGAKLVYGLNRAASKEEMKQSLENGTVEKYMNWVPVHKNDVFFIPSGTIHAIGRGVLIVEIQQNSNLTYRLYDYGRLGKDGKPRELHVDKALDVADLSGLQNPRQPMRVLRYGQGFATELLAHCRYFEVSRGLLNSSDTVLSAMPESFRVLTCLDGEGKLREEGETLAFHKGDTLFIPATAPDVHLSGQTEFLMTRC
ncbi:MAG: class I mannose-6-phosphate isomerase [Paludibacteraceae bacterium]|nr:class I mannose-6-phosphate isomerase [Paludibacteraceae bacterium]